MDFNTLMKLKNKQAKQQARKEVAQETTGWKGFANKTKSVATKALDFRPATVNYVDKHVIALDDKVEVINETFSKQIAAIYNHLGLENNEQEIASETVEELVRKQNEAVNTFKDNIYKGNGINHEMDKLQSEIKAFENELDNLTMKEAEVYTAEDPNEIQEFAKARNFLLSKIESLKEEKAKLA